MPRFPYEVQLAAKEYHIVRNRQS